MTQLTHSPGEPRVAVVGAGPAGLYAADILRGQAPGAQIDVLEALPSPFGLIRYGVAPDHPRIKSIVDSLHEILDRGDIRFYGNVTVGSDLTLDELRARYDVILLATGALQDAELDIPGIDLPGSFGAADFVAWYDSHPDYPQTWPLEAESVAVIGNGNVALDVTRVLARRPADLARTDMPAHVRRVFEASPVRDIHVFGRRGPAAAKFSPLELRELGLTPGVKMLLDAEDFDLNDADRAAMAANGRLRQVVKTMEQWRAGHDGAGERRIHLHFYSRPERVEGTSAVTGLTVRRTAPDGAGGVVDTDELRTYPVGAVYRAVGYFGSPVEGAPFDAARGVVPHLAGRVIDASGRPVPGLYVTGWIKRGPVGLIGSTKSDALETIASIVEDLPDLAGARDPSAPPLADLLAARGVEVVTWEGWQAIDALERANGEAEGRARAKLATRRELISAAAASSVTS
ncbi:MAG: FAD-dependent oxidoreductase [Bifidobacteriaceae bacterium]|nr:FAD-dependent oxidoreductase [Bifidobacteriaceae bacterium]